MAVFRILEKDFVLLNFNQLRIVLIEYKSMSEGNENQGRLKKFALKAV